MASWSSLLRVVEKAVELERATRPGRPRTGGAGRRGVGAARSAARTATAPARRVVGAAARRLSYAPQRDGAADPGEVVWTAVAYEDQPDVVKDRPVLVVGRKDAGTVLGLMLSSQERRGSQPGWLALGTGAWDAGGRPSFVRLDRVLELRDDSIRREGAVLDRQRFEQVSRALRDRGWSG